MRKTEKKKCLHGKRIIPIVIEVTLILMVVGVAITAYTLSRTHVEITVEPDFSLVPATEAGENLENISEYETMQVTDIPVQKLETLETEEYSDSEYRHYLVLGIDHEGKANENGKCDAIMIFSVSEKTGRLVLTSIPRDTYIYIMGKGFDKIAYAYTYGKTSLVAKTLSTNFDLTFSGYFTVDFEGIEEIVDILGGIEISLSKAESEHIAEFFGIEGTREGINQLDGEQALAYSRIRKIDSDFERTNRQYKILCALYNKFKKMSSSVYPKMITKLYPCITTACSPAECIDLASGIYEAGANRPEHILLFEENDGEGKNIAGLYYFVLNNLEKSVIEWHNYLGNEEYIPSKSVQEISKYLLSIKK